MKLFAIYITNNATAYGGAQTIYQAVLFVFALDRTATYDENGYVVVW